MVHSRFAAGPSFLYQAECAILQSVIDFVVVLLLTTTVKLPLSVGSITMESFFLRLAMALRLCFGRMEVVGGLHSRHPYLERSWCSPGVVGLIGAPGVGPSVQCWLGTH